MELSPILYHRLVRPKWFNQIYIHNRIKKHFDLKNKNVLDFGAGTGINCTICKPGNYYGIDPDVKRINFAKKLYPHYDFDVLNDEQLSIQEQTIDVILIVSVLHHIPTEKIKRYMQQFRKVLKPNGKIVAIEPCFFKKRPISNWYMKTNDNGNYIQDEQGYHHYFNSEGFQCKTIEKFRKCLLYNELFFVGYLHKRL